MRDRWTRSDVDGWLESRGLSGQLRAEALSFKEFLALAGALRERWGQLPLSPMGAASKPRPELVHEPEEDGEE